MDTFANIGSALPPVSSHSIKRMAQRGLRPEDIAQALLYGRIRYIRRAHITVVGRREVDYARRQGVDIRALEGIHVICSPDGVVLTVYRNKNLNVRGRQSRRGDRR